MKSKTIIISAPEENKSNGRGILTLFLEDDLLKCRIRLYNVNKLNKFCKLGIYHENEVYSANLLEKNGVYESSMVGNFDMDKDFYTALIDTSNSNYVILSGGTYQGHYFNDYSVFNKEEIIDVETEAAIDAEIKKSDCNDDCDRCANCKYKEYFYSQIKEEQTVKEQDVKTTNNEIKKENAINVINSLIPQFDYIFNNYKPDEELNSLVLNSRFVKIDENQEEYSIGTIYDNDNLKYICYAIKRDYNSKVPDELGEHYQWLPIDKEDPLSEGYFIVFQDAKDLKILEF